MKEMPLYTCHKEVRALKIASVTPLQPSHVRIAFEDGAFEPLTVDVSKKPTPEPGFYMVQYADGYVSFSPGQQFEDGYTLNEGPAENLAPADGVVPEEAEQPKENVDTQH